MAGAMGAIEELLKNKIGLDPSSVGPQLILARSESECGN